MSYSQFREHTLRVLREHGVSDEDIGVLDIQIAGIASGPRREIKTRKQVRDEAMRIARSAVELIELLKDFDPFPSTGDVYTSRRMARPTLEPMVLVDQLERLRKAATYTIEATSDAQGVAQLALRERGPAPDPVATAIASAVLWRLHFAGVKVTTVESGAAIDCLQCVMIDAGMDHDIDYRHCVRRWLSKNRLSPLWRRFGVRAQIPRIHAKSR